MTSTVCASLGQRLVSAVKTRSPIPELPVGGQLSRGRSALISVVAAHVPELVSE